MDWTFERVEMPELGILRYNIYGIETNAITEVSQVRLCDRLHNEPHWTGVMLDYSQNTISYTLPEFTDRLNYIVKNLPAQVKLAYVFNAQTLVVTARASKLLTSHGVNAQAFSNAEEALEFLKSNESWSRQA